MLRRYLLPLVLLSAVHVEPVSGQQNLSPEQLEFFEAKIRPVLVEHCYECHNSAGNAEGNMVLDHRTVMLKGGDSGGLFHADMPSQSLLLKVVRHEIEGLEMPEGGSQLPPSVIADLERWVEMGAPDPRLEPPSPAELDKATAWETIRDKRKQWWSFQPIQIVQPPPVAAGNPIDRFIIDKLAAVGLKPSAVADKRTLLRRATFAVTGLPPTEAQTQQFLSDDSETAFASLVDRLLASPQFGERWARHWMDWIRYAESHGSEGDPAIENAWMYRDYLIRSLNDDVPYDQLVKEHIAGDLLPSPRINPTLQLNESLIATAHWRMVFHGFAPTDALDEKVRFTDDQVDAFSKAFLGLTVSCARCHNHKFDAISQADYYALSGIIGSTRPGRAAADSLSKQDTNREQLAKLKVQIRQAIADDWLNSLPELPARMAALPGDGIMLQSWNASKDGSAAETWKSLEQDLQVEQRQRTEFAAQPEAIRWVFDGQGEQGGQWFAYGIGVDAKPVAPGEFLIAPDGDEAIVGVFPAAVISGTLSTKHSARLESPQVKVDGDYELWLNITGGGNAAYRYVVQNYPRNGTVYPVKTLTKEPGQWQWQSFDLTYWNGDDIHIELTNAKDAPLLTTGDERSWFGIREAMLIPKGGSRPSQKSTRYLAPLFDGRPAPTSSDELAEAYAATIRTAVTRWRDGGLSNDQALLLEHCRAHGLVSSKLADLPTAGQLIQQYRQLEAAVPVPTRVPSLTEWKGQDQPLYVRGNHKQPGESVPRRFLEAIDDTPYNARLSGRLQLANDVLREDNPLTRRVIVNSVWHHLFGAGIVSTPDNLGRLGAEPTHPELLDFMAHRFSAEQGWSLKALIRSLVTSQTWQQSSTTTAMSREVDPQNLWLSHANLRRLDAESIRDQLLMTSGNLNSDMFGPPVPGTASRRSVYVSIIRNRLDPFLATFDAPVPFGTRGRRDVTNVPAQALMMLNDPFVIAAAERIAEQVTQRSRLTSDSQRIQEIWRLSLGRLAEDGEVSSASELLNSLRRQYAQTEADRSRTSQLIADCKREVADILSPARNKLEAELAGDSAPAVDLQPVAVWDFEGDANDRIGGLNAQLKGTAKIADGALILDGQGWAATTPLTQTLKAKSLEVTVQLDDLNQRSGGVMTVQGTNGVLFDSIVFAERQPRRWMAGSNNFARTQDFNGPEETSAAAAPVHIVLTYQMDGTIAAYRNGEPFGSPYSTGSQAFAKNSSHIIFGMRHGQTTSPGRMLRGRLFEAKLYGRALTPDEVRSAANGGRKYVTDEQVLAALSERERNRVMTLQAEIAAAEARLVQLGVAVPAGQEWTDLAHSLFNLKEFIYVR